MSVSTTISSIEYTGNNSIIAAYAIPFVFFDNDDIECFVIDDEGVETELVLDSDFTLTGENDPEGGSLLTIDPWNNTYTVRITRNPAFTQPYELEEGQAQVMTTLEKSQDRVVMLAQRLSYVISTLPATLTATLSELFDPVGSADAAEAAAAADATAKANAAAAASQPLDANIVSVASPSDDDMIQRVGGSWVKRSLAQIKSSLGLGSLAYQTGTFSAKQDILAEGAFVNGDKTKLDGFQAVLTAGAVMNGDTSTAAMQFVIDEDSMTTNSATKVPTQQSVKAYVDASVIAAGAGDMTKAVYDPTNKLADAFSMNNMVEGTSTKILTATERTKLAGIATAATANSSDATLLSRANHTGTQLASTISDFSAAVAATASVTANTAKVSNATHTGDVTGATALTIANDAVTNAKAANMAVNTIKGRISSGTGDPEDLTAEQVRTIIGATGITFGTIAATTSGTAVEFTSLPAGIKRISIILKGVSTNGNSRQIIQLGTSSAYLTSGYNGGATGTANTVGFITHYNQASADEHHGLITLVRLGSGNNNWIMTGLVSRETNTEVSENAGSVDLGGELTRLRLTTEGGSNTFDTGSMNIIYE